MLTIQDIIFNQKCLSKTVESTNFLNGLAVVLQLVYIFNG